MKLTPRGEVAQDHTFSYTFLPASKQPLIQRRALDRATRIGLEAGLTAGVCVLIVVVGLLIYYLRRRKSKKNADITQPSIPRPDTPRLQMSELPTQHQVNGRRYEMSANTNESSGGMDIQALPTIPQKAAVVYEKGVNEYHGAPPAAELEGRNAWNRYHPVHELYSGAKTPYTELPATSGPAELGNTSTTSMPCIPRKPVGSPTQASFAAKAPLATTAMQV